MGKRMNRQFSKEAQMENNLLKKCSTSLALAEAHIKTTLRFYPTPLRMDH
jgi:hypothetical protein